MLNARRIGVPKYDTISPRPIFVRPGKLFWKGNCADVIRMRVSDALRKTDSGNYFITKPIFIPAESMILIDEIYLCSPPNINPGWIYIYTTPGLMLGLSHIKNKSVIL